MVKCELWDESKLELRKAQPTAADIATGVLQGRCRASAFIRRSQPIKHKQTRFTITNSEAWQSGHTSTPRFSSDIWLATPLPPNTAEASSPRGRANLRASCGMEFEAKVFVSIRIIGEVREPRVTRALEQGHGWRALSLFAKECSAWSLHMSHRAV